MTQTKREEKEAVVPACPLYQDGFVGYCEGCAQRTDCILLTVLQRVEQIEMRLERLAY
ncbi:MAG: hypothetical protein SVP26_09290 [Chloroflexota bacterium]|nr:hypothetical protein [Chloroflexota bacterium]